MPEKKISGTTIVDRAKLEALLKERSEILAKVEVNLVQLHNEVNHLTEQQIGLKHRINELTELLK